MVTRIGDDFDIVVQARHRRARGGLGADQGVAVEFTDMVIGGITDFVVDTVVRKAIPQLISLFIPGAGFITAIIKIYDTVMVFVQKISKIIQVVTAFIDSIVRIAAGDITSAANKVESVLAGLLSLAINFLAGFVGLGRVADKVMGVLRRVQGIVDRALDKLVEWIVRTARSLFARAFGRADRGAAPTQMTSEQKLTAAIEEGSRLAAAPDATPESVRAALPAIRARYRLTVLTLVIDSESDEELEAHIHAEINPTRNAPHRRIPKSARTTKIGDIDIPREEMRWLRATKVTIAKKWRAAAAAAGESTRSVLASGRLVGRKYGRRHIVSFADMRDHFAAGFHKNMTVAQAVAILARFGIEASYTKRSVRSKIMTLVRRAYNWPQNLRIGLQQENASLGREVDVAMLERHGGSVQKMIDDHVRAFLLEFAIPGVPFGVTQRQAVIEWEVTEE